MSVSKINFNDKNEAFLTVDSMEFIDKDELKKYLDLESPYFLKCEFKSDDLFTFLYDCTKCVPLKEYLSHTIQAKSALGFLKTLIQTFVEAEKQSMNLKNILLGVQNVFVVPDKDQVVCIYVPVVDGVLQERPLRLFIKELFVNMMYSEEDDMRWLGNLIRYLNKNRNLVLDDLYAFVESLEDDNIAGSLDEISFTVDAFEGDSESVKELSEEIKDINKVDETPKSDEETDEFSMLKAVLNMTAVKPINIEETAVSAEDVCIETEESVEDTEEVNETSCMSYLYRRSKHTEYVLNGSITRIGKALDNEICITDNPVISRLHAIITLGEEGYTIRDNCSTNHTFVNGFVLKGDQEKLLTENDRIVLGNEEFIFKTK